MVSELLPLPEMSNFGIFLFILRSVGENNVTPLKKLVSALSSQSEASITLPKQTTEIGERSCYKLFIMNPLVGFTLS